jgi:hypothetical protein
MPTFPSLFHPLLRLLQARLLKRYLGSSAEKAVYTLWGVKAPVFPRQASQAAPVGGGSAAMHHHQQRLRTMVRDCSMASFFSATATDGLDAASSLGGLAGSSSVCFATDADVQQAQAQQEAVEEEWELVAAKVVCSQRALAALLEIGLPPPGPAAAAAARPASSRFGPGVLVGDGSGGVDQSLMDFLLAVLRGGAWQIVSGAFLEALMYHVQVGKGKGGKDAAPFL